MIFLATLENWIDFARQPSHAICNVRTQAQSTVQSLR